jgi:hypothetical protein
MAMTTGQMVAAKRKSASEAVPSQRVKRLPSLADIMRAPMGRAAIKELVAAGVEQARLESAIRFVVFVQIMPAVRIHDVKGFSRKSLALFPEELRRAATRIEMVRGNPFYGMAESLFLPSSHWEEICKNLRAYADFWDVLIHAVRQAAEDNPRECDLRLFGKRRLMAVVAEATGEPHYNLVEELLNAAYGIVGLRLLEEESALRRLWKNHVKKSTKRHYRRLALMLDY